MNIYLDKIQNDEERLSKGLRKQSMPDHVYDYFLRITGLASAADVHVAQLLKACDSHNRRQPRIALFAAQMGLLNPEEPPSMDIRDTDFILHVLTSLIKQGELMPDLFKSLKSRSAVIKSSVLLRPDVLRISAVHLVHDTFQKWLPDGGDDYVLKAKAMQSTEKGFRYVVSEAVIKLFIDLSLFNTITLLHLAGRGQPDRPADRPLAHCARQLGGPRPVPVPRVCRGSPRAAGSDLC
jgi:hypothetical protein